MFDENGDGFIQEKELRNVLTKYNPNLSLESNFMGLMSNMMRNKDGEVKEVFKEIIELKVSLKESDFFKKGCWTILNSETAALKIAEDLFNKLGTKGVFEDEDFGPNPLKSQ